MRLTTLTFVFNQQDEVLMIEKKRGMGKGLWNFPGGKIEPGEEPAAAAAREVLEETGIAAHDLAKIGLLEFLFSSAETTAAVTTSGSWNNVCQVFVSRSFTGEPLGDIDECRSFWWPIDKIPYDRLWPDDRLWVPEVFAGRTFHRRYLFDEHNHLLKEDIFDAP